MSYRCLLLTSYIIGALGRSTLQAGRNTINDHKTTRQQINPDCVFPCRCSPDDPYCSDDASYPIARDECGCCLTCPVSSSAGETCGGLVLCQEGLTCRQPPGEVQGTCVPNIGRSCLIQNYTYDHGATFLLDCRTQCTCQNGTYACSSLCPQENISPAQGTCSHPRLVEVPGQCCREWLCDPPDVEESQNCLFELEPWSTCSAHCGVGLSTRTISINPFCKQANETRLCQRTPCHNKQIRSKSHRGRALPSVLQLGTCTSHKRYRPKSCTGSHQTKCKPSRTTTIKVSLICPEDYTTDAQSLFRLLQPGVDLWTPAAKDKNKQSLQRHDFMENFYPLATKQNADENLKVITVNVQWVQSCSCGSTDRRKTRRLHKSKRIVDFEEIYDEKLRRVHRTAAP